MRRNGETLQADGSGKSYRQETKFPNSWMRLRKYATRQIRIFRPRVFSRMILLTGALRCLPKVYTSSRRSIQTTIGWQRVLRRMSSSQTSPKPSNPQSFYTSRFKVITSGETDACAGQLASACNLNILPATAGNAAGQAAPHPRRTASVPSPLMTGNHVSFFGKFFRQIIPLSIRYTLMSGTPSFIQAPGDHTAGVSDKTYQPSVCEARKSLTM
jgi:hypothetical protein